MLGSFQQRLASDMVIENNNNVLNWEPIKEGVTPTRLCK